MSATVRHIANYTKKPYRTVEAAWRQAKKQANRAGEKGNYLCVLRYALTILDYDPTRLPEGVGSEFTTLSGKHRVIVEATSPDYLTIKYLDDGWGGEHPVVLIPLFALIFMLPDEPPGRSKKV